MANPTTNYGFVLPTSTDLVTDLPADFDVALQGVDTRLKALQPGTTLGDIAYSSATANTNTRLAVGANGTYLTVTAGVPAWGAISAGGMTLLSTTTLSGTSTTISSIDQTYRNLEIIVSGMRNGGNRITIAPNADTGITRSQGTSSGSSVGLNVGYLQIAGQQLGVFDANTNAFAATIHNYASTTAFKPYSVCATFTNTSGTALGSFNGGGIATTSAITSLVFDADGNTFTSGTVLIYGVK
jgi:hypothetical protein